MRSLRRKAQKAPQEAGLKSQSESTDKRTADARRGVRFLFFRDEQEYDKQAAIKRMAEKGDTTI